MQPFFSVIIPLYNKEHFIENTLKSVLAQSFTDYEIIIVNDGSIDNSVEIANKTLSGFKNSNLINQNNSGLSSARNNGIKSANGKIIALLDADDIWHIDFLQTIYDLYLKFPDISIFGTDYIEKYREGNELESKKNLDVDLKNKMFTVEDFFEANMFQSIVCQSSIAIKKEVFEDFLFDETLNYAEDVDFYIRCFLKYKIAYAYKPMATILYNIPNQITNIGIKNKKLPDLDEYERKHPDNSSLKKYLDFKRYMYAIQSKINGDKVAYMGYIKNIDYDNLTTKQYFLLKCPILLLKLIKSFKKSLLRFNIKLTSFKN